MSKNGAPPPAYGFVAPPSAPPSYAQGQLHEEKNTLFSFSNEILIDIRIIRKWYLAVGGVPPSSPFVPQQTTTTHIVTTVLPIGNHPTHMICPR